MRHRKQHLYYKRTLSYKQAMLHGPGKSLVAFCNIFVHGKGLRNRLYIYVASLASTHAVMRFPVANNRSDESDNDDEYHNHFNIILQTL